MDLASLRSGSFFQFFPHGGPPQPPGRCAREVRKYSPYLRGSPLQTNSSLSLNPHDLSMQSTVVLSVSCPYHEVFSSTGFLTYIICYSLVAQQPTPTLSPRLKGPSPYHHRPTEPCIVVTLHTARSILWLHYSRAHNLLVRMRTL